MKLLFLLLLAGSAFAGDWQAVQRLPHDQKIEVTTRDGSRTRASFVSAAEEALVVRENSGSRSISRADIRKCAYCRSGAAHAQWLHLDGGGCGCGRRHRFDLMPLLPQ